MALSSYVASTIGGWHQGPLAESGWLCVKIKKVCGFLFFFVEQ